MSCTDETPGVEREITLPAPPDEVWESLPSLLGDDVELAAEPGGRLRVREPDGERVGVVEEVDAPRRLAFWWVPAGDDDANDGFPSRVELELFPTQAAGSGVGTLLRVRERRGSTRQSWSMACCEVRLPAHAPDRVFSALADPTRCRVVERLGLAPATAGEIAAQLPVSRQAVVKHLAVLEAAGLAEGTREGRKVVYRLTPGQFAAARWMGDVGAAMGLDGSRVRQAQSGGPDGSEPPTRVGGPELAA